MIEVPLSILGSTATLEHGEGSLDLIFPQDPLRESSRECALFKRGHEETRKLLRSCPPAGVDNAQTLTPVPQGAILSTGIGPMRGEAFSAQPAGSVLLLTSPANPFHWLYFVLNIYFWRPPVLIAAGGIFVGAPPWLLSNCRASSVVQHRN